ncbi:MAG: hypothetical protein ACPGRD_02255 [Planktomarina sp.]
MNQDFPSGAEIPLLMIVVDPAQVRDRRTDAETLDRTHITDINDLIDDVSQLSPNVVLCPLFTPEFDALDVLTILQDCQFNGRVRILTEPLSNMDLVLAELRGPYPDLDIDLMIIEAHDDASPAPN